MPKRGGGGGGGGWLRNLNIGSPRLKTGAASILSILLT